MQLAVSKTCPPAAGSVVGFALKVHPLGACGGVFDHVTIELAALPGATLLRGVT